MQNKTALYLFLGQISLILGLVVCFLILPEILGNQGGVSNYGVHSRTVVPFSLAVGLASFLTLQAARGVPQKLTAATRYRTALFILSFLFALLLLSTYPYKYLPFFETFHILIAILLFGYEIILASWLTLKVRRNRLNILLWGTFLFGSLLGVLSLMKTFEVLFIAQSIAGIAFGILLVRTVPANKL